MMRQQIYGKALGGDMNRLYQRLADRWTGWFFLMLPALFTVGAMGAYAQSENGSIAGKIADTTGAVIPNATVT